MSAGDDNEWVCPLCNCLHTNSGSVLLLCDGPCKRSFHLDCLGMSEADIPENEWLCDECTAGRHTCFICGDEGEVTNKLRAVDAFGGCATGIIRGICCGRMARRSRSAAWRIAENTTITAA